MQQFHNATIDPTQPPLVPLFHKSNNFIGQRFSRLTVLEFAGRNKHKLLVWKCLCDCGNETLAYGSHLKRGVKQSCGCLISEVTSNRSKIHGMKNTITYNSWRCMIGRCTRQTDIGYAKYGAAGITVCDRWLNSFVAFYEDMGERPSKEYQIERIENSGNYTPDNCKWATRKEQARNRVSSRRLTFDGKTLTIAEWCEVTGMKQGQIANRLHLGWSVEKILTTPVRPKAAAKWNKPIEWRGESRTIPEWSTILGISAGAIRQRLAAGWSINDTFTRPYKGRRSR